MTLKAKQHDRIVSNLYLCTGIMELGVLVVLLNAPKLLSVKQINIQVAP